MTATARSAGASVAASARDAEAEGQRVRIVDTGESGYAFSVVPHSTWGEDRSDRRHDVTYEVEISVPGIGTLRNPVVQARELLERSTHSV